MIGKKNILCRRRMRYLLTFLFLFTIVTGMDALRVKAADPHAVKTAKENVLSGGKFEKTEDGIRYLQADKTYAKNCWALIGGSVYRFNAEGYVKTGAFHWKTYSYRADNKGRLYVRRLYKTGSKTYYYGATGAMAKKMWKNIKGASYYFNANGVMAKSCWVGNYYVNAKGVRQKNCWIKGHYLDSSGLRVDNLTQKQIKNAGTKEERESKERLIIIGASRVLQMGTAVTGDERVVYFAKIHAGYKWFMKHVYHALQRYLEVYPYSTVVIQLGNNDLQLNDDGNFVQYAEVYKKLLADYPEASFYFMDALPGKRGSVGNELRKQFNQKLRAAFPAQYIGGYDYMMKAGYTYRSKTDTNHYDNATYWKIYKYILRKTGWKG